MDYLRTPAEAFSAITDFPYQEHYIELEKGFRMHYVDEGSGEIILCLHGEPSWSYLYRKFIPILTPKYRLVAPDLIGFGKSDKLPKMKDYSYTFHFNCIREFIEKMNLQEITLVVQDWGGLLGLGVLGASPELFKRVVIMNTALPIGKPLPIIFKLWKAYARWHPSLPVGKIVTTGCHRTTSKTKAIKSAYDAPFPSRKYKAAARVFPMLVPSKPDQDGVEIMKRAREVLKAWTKPAIILFSDKDPILGGMVHFFRKLVPAAGEQRQITIKDAGHFLQEDAGEEIAGYIDQFIKGELKTP